MQNENDPYLQLDRVAIIGRPNVGKSTLFNVITGKRKALVKNQPGVTRDILIESCELWGKNFEIIDTGGLTEEEDNFSKAIKDQVEEFLKSVDLIIVVMDGRAGLVPEDRDVFRLAASTGRPFLVVVNKIDSQMDEPEKLSEFFEFGENVVAASFETRRGLTEVLEWIHPKLRDVRHLDQDEFRIAIVGKPNVGKSSLVNTLLGEKRMLVSAVAGTTTDAVDTPFYYNDRKYILVDTAGLRRSARRDEEIEILSAFKSQESVRRAHLVLLVMDSSDTPSGGESKILELILDEHKPVIAVANKSDLGKEVEEFRKKYREKVDEQFHFFKDLRLVYTSAQTGAGLKDLLAEIERMRTLMSKRISTSDLNNFFVKTIRRAPAPVFGHTNVKFYYITQTLQRPPSFIAFANYPDGVDAGYRRFLVKHLKTEFDLWGMPIRIFVMNHRGRSE